ncbi:MAG: hypothetical protein COW29_08915, partial [Rhodobacterales bacterium CG15_BIG_FIL_POST_REV_8_21_14_020_59_13]
TLQATPTPQATYVPGWGHLSSHLVIIGEAPSDHECAHRPPMPFVGPSGYRLMEWLSAVGLTRDYCWIDNVYPYKAPHNNLDALGKGLLLPFMSTLHQRIAALDDPWVIVPLGNYPLYALLSLGKVSWHRKDGRQERPGILAHRGGVYTYRDLRGRSITVIPSIHPSATFKNPAYERACRADWEKIARELVSGPQTPLPHRTILSNPSPTDIANFYQAALAAPTTLLTFDIERPAGKVTIYGKPTKRYPKGKPTRHKDYRAGKVVCISFCLDPFTQTITIPLSAKYWNTHTEWAGFDAWGWVKALLALPNPKGTQNGLYDVWHCEDYGCKVVNWWYDSLYLHHAENPRDKHSLEYLASVDLRTQYWKDECKNPDTLTGWTEREDQLRVYCGKDSSHTSELITLYCERIDQATWDRYRTHYVALFAPLMALMRHGLRVDVEEADRRLRTLTEERASIRKTLKALTGYEILATKAISVKKLSDYLYRRLQLPEQYKKRATGMKKTVTTDEVAIKRLAIQYPERFPLDVEEGILRSRRVQKLMESYNPQHWDPDGRMRSMYSPNTQQGRLSSKKNPRGSGTNGQNIDVEARDIFLADEGKVMVIVDLSQAESRVNRCYIHSLTGDLDTLWKAQAAPADWDDHSAMTQRIFEIPNDQPAQIAANRPLGKMIVHASQRRMQGKTLADKLLKDRGEVVLPERADALIQKAIHAQPGLLDYFRWVEFQIQSTRRLVSCWGVPLSFQYDRLNSAVYRDGYSFLMQDAVGRLTNQYGMRWMWERDPLNLWQRGIARLNAQWHDGLLVSLPPDPQVISHWVAGLMDSLATPLNLNGTSLKMPSTVKMGLHTNPSLEWKWRPSVEEVEAGLVSLNVTPVEIGG